MKHVILQGTVGSHAYGLNHAESDIDTLGVFMYDIMDYLTLEPPQESFVSHEPDVTLHELRKYLRLALKCNPTVLELLWLDDYTIKTYAGEMLLENKYAFLSAPFVKDAFLGYARSQLTRLKDREGKRQVKHAKHMARLINQGYDLYTIGDMDLKVDRYWMDAFLDQTVEQWEDFFQDAIAGFERSKSVLPEKPDRARIERLLASIMEGGPR